LNFLHVRDLVQIDHGTFDVLAETQPVPGMRHEGEIEIGAGLNRQRRRTAHGDTHGRLVYRHRLVGENAERAHGRGLGGGGDELVAKVVMRKAGGIGADQGRIGRQDPGGVKSDAGNELPGFAPAKSIVDAPCELDLGSRIASLAEPGQREQVGHRLLLVKGLIDADVPGESGVVVDAKRVLGRHDSLHWVDGFGRGGAFRRPGGNLAHRPGQTTDRMRKCFGIFSRDAPGAPNDPANRHLPSSRRMRFQFASVVRGFGLIADFAVMFDKDCQQVEITNVVIGFPATAPFVNVFGKQGTLIEISGGLAAGNVMSGGVAAAKVDEIAAHARKRKAHFPLGCKNDGGKGCVSEMAAGLIEAVHGLLRLCSGPDPFGKMLLADGPAHFARKIGQDFGGFFSWERKVAPVCAEIQFSKTAYFQKGFRCGLGKGGICRMCCAAPAAAGCARGTRRSSCFPGTQCSLSPLRRCRECTRAAGSEMVYCFSRVTIIKASFGLTAFQRDSNPLCWREKRILCTGKNSVPSPIASMHRYSPNETAAQLHGGLEKPPSWNCNWLKS